MPPKQQKMGSITHNSSEINQKGSKGGMLSKLFSGGGSTSHSKTTAGSNCKNGKMNGLSSSLPPHATACNAQKLSRRSFTVGGNVAIPEELMDEFAARASGVPTSITTLVDAASVLTEDFTYAQPSQSYYQPLQSYPRQSFRPRTNEQMLDGSRRPSMASHGTEIASRALANMHLSVQSSDMGLTRNNSGDRGQIRQKSGEHQNPGYHNNYTHENYTHENYDDNGPSYYDESGGGIFDDSYMQSSRISVSAQQPPPPDRRAYNRKSSMSTSASAEHAAPSHGPRVEAKRHSIENVACSPPNLPPHQRRISVEFEQIINFDPRTSVQRPFQRPSNANRSSLSKSTVSKPIDESEKSDSIEPMRRSTIVNNGRSRNSESDTSDSIEPMRRSSIVNNNGRALTRSSHHSSTSSSTRVSATAYDNTNWFTLDSSDRTEPIRKNDNLRIPMKFRDDDDRTMATMATKAQAFRPSAMNKAKDMRYPEGDVTIVFTDVQGSTSLWETCPSDMKKALDIHDMILRQCYSDHHGYEITTEGDSFNLAFQHPADALAFALQAQLKLYKADWPDGILKHPDGKDEPALKFRGFRVRFGIHHGPTTSGAHEMTDRTVYSGEGVDIAKTVEGLCHGGQILTTMETWKAVSGMAERYLGRPQVLDCGEHLLFETKSQIPGNSGLTTTRYTRRIMQLVPSDLAFDFFEARGRRDVPSDDGQMDFEVKDSSAVNGRLFPPLKSKRQLTTGFLNAPYANGKVTVCFVYTVGLDDNPDSRPKNLGVLAKYVRKQLLILNPPGYECQEDNGCWMIAFDRMVSAVTFGLQIKSNLQGVDELVGTVDRDNMFKVGIVSGPFTSMGPHKITGMADYFGPIVNRSARVASNCEPGQVCVGIALSNGVTADPPDFGPTVGVKLQGIKKLKGITIDMAIFECFKRRIETPYM